MSTKSAIPRFNRKKKDGSKPENSIDSAMFEDGDYMAAIPILEDSLPYQSSSNSGNLNSKKKKKVTIAALMDEKMEEALAVPISSSNIGFQLLKKKGYNEGEGLGRDGQGVLDPIAIKKRSSQNMAGVGIEEESLRKKVCQDIERKEKEARRTQLKNDFIIMNSKQCLLRRLNIDIEGAKKAIYELDLQNGVQSNILWPVIYLVDSNNVICSDLTDIGEA